MIREIEGDTVRPDGGRVFLDRLRLRLSYALRENDLLTVERAEVRAVPVAGAGRTVFEGVVVDTSEGLPHLDWPTAMLSVVGSFNRDVDPLATVEVASGKLA